MDSEEREVGVNSVGESRMDKTGSGLKTEESQRDWKCSLKHEEAALDQWKQDDEHQEQLLQ